MKRVFAVLLAFLILISMFACGESIEDLAKIEVADVEKLETVETSDDVADAEPAADMPGEEATAEEDGNDAPVETSDTAAGKATYTFYGKVQDDAFEEEEITGKVTVPSWFAYAIRVEGVSANQKVSYKSSNTKYAIVDANGMVVFKKAGTVKITLALIENGKTLGKKTIQLTAVSAPTKVSVILPEEMPSSAALNGSTLVMNKGSGIQLSTVFTPYFTISEVKWKTSNAKIAAISSAGLLTAVGKGTAKITVTTKNKKTKSFSVKVVGENDAVAISLNGDTTMDISEEGQLTYTFTPENAVSTVKWSTSNKKVCSVSTGGVLTPQKCGSATITATASSGVKASVKVVITDKTLPTSITLDQTGTVTLYKNQTLQLNATVLPETATGKITWSSSAKTYATVSSEGLVTPKKSGTVTITAKTRNGKTAKVKVKVIMKTEPAVKYRALIIGQSYTGTDYELTGCLRDAQAFTGMLATMETTPYTVTKKTDLDAAEILSSITSAFAGADADDVSLFYYSGHGKYPKGDLVGDDFAFVSITNLKAQLDTIPGTKIVILDSCYSGQMITANGESDVSTTPADIDAYIISVFKESGALATNSDLGSEYYVITASSAEEESGEWSTGSVRYGAFTYFFLFGSGYNEIKLSSMKTLAADTNGDGAISVYEGKRYAYNSLLENTDDQHVQCYPSNSAYILWQR